MSSPLKQLLSIISSGVETLESAYAKDGLPFPSLDEPFTPTPLDGNMQLVSTVHLIVAAASQLIATVRPPMETLQDLAPGMYTSATIGIVVENDVADILKEAGPKGLHADEIGARSGLHGSKLARVLRYLATRHMFKEVSPNVFANNRVSTILIKAKSLKEIKADPDAKYDGAPPAAFVAHATDENLSSLPYMAQFLRDPQGAAAPFNMMLKRPTRMWEWFEEPGNTWRGRRFVAAMKSGDDLYPPSTFRDGFNWKSLKQNDVVVDVGGNVGPVTLILAKAFPHLRYIVQDLDKVIGEGHEFWKNAYPEAISSGLVKLQAHDFFKPQPVQGAAVYFMRLVIHDWPEVEVHKFLKATRAAASPTSKLVVFDFLMPHACENLNSPLTPPPRTKNPKPLLPNVGDNFGTFLTYVDLQMLNLFDGQERTVEEFIALGKATGWKLEAVNPGALVTFVFTPA